MNKINFIILILFLALMSCKQEELNPETLDEKVDIIANAHMVFGRIPGVAIGIINNGEVSQYFYGTKDLNTGEPIDELTYFQIASITKTFTATLIAELVNKGEMSLNDTVNHLLPKSLHVPDFNGIPVTLKQLLNHTSGLEREPKEVETKRYYHYGLDYMASYLEKTSLQTAPGNHYEYSNTGFGLAGIIAAQYYQKDYKQVIKQQIFTSLDMHYSVCDWDDTDSENIAVDYFGAKPAEYENYSEPFAGAYAIKTNLHDLMIYLQTQIDHSGSALKEAIDLTIIPTFDMPMTKANNDVKSKQVGLGWVTFTFEDDKRYIYHNGGLIGSSSFIGYNPDSGEGVVVLINSFCPGVEQDIIGFELLDFIGEH
jgi:D-alanyl-D-alanine-carboxypeptidase/D-alanyl-D-alanine-endopeptidase